MDPATTCCPRLACPARGPTGQGNLGIHSRQDKRFRCTACHKTCSATTGTALYRLRTAAETVTLVVTWRAHGCPPPAIVVAFGFDERTVARGMARGGVPGQAVQEPLVEPPRALGQVPADASRVKQQGGMVWMALAMRSSTRFWLAGEVRAHRAMPLMRRRIERGRRGAAPRPLLGCTDGVCSSIRAMRETCRDPVPPGQGGRPRRRPWRHVLIAQVVNRDARRRVVETERRIVDGPPARVEPLRRRSQGDGVINTADSERLNATCRARVASLTRRGRALARRPLPFQDGLYRIGTVYNFCTPHESVCVAGGQQTSAMAAGITNHGWTIQALLAFHVPPPRWTPPKRRGRPSHALKRLMERWGRDHG
jgi:hypothetical protein